LEIGLPDYAIQLNNVLTSPLYYHINILPNAWKNKIKEKYNNHLRQIPDGRREMFRGKYESIFRFLDEPTQHDKKRLQQAFKHITTRLDKGREESFTEVYPYYAEWFNQIEETNTMNLGDIL